MHTLQQTVQTLMVNGIIGLFALIFSTVLYWWLDRKESKLKEVGE